MNATRGEGRPGGVRTMVGAMAGAALAVGAMGIAVPALAAQHVGTDEAAGGTGEKGSEGCSIASVVETASALVKADASQGTFSWSQSVTTPNDVILHRFSTASKALCGSISDPIVNVNPLDWQLSVTGDVTNEYTVSISELAGDESVTQTMSCTCGGNPADGVAIAFAQTQGIPVSSIVQRAGAKAGANTITFISADGTQVSMPLAYVVGHHGVISYAVNGEDLSASVGGNNQLWLKGTSANYFVRDIVEVRVSAQDEVPTEPGQDMSYPNSPNVGVFAADVDRS